MASLTAYQIDYGDGHVGRTDSTWSDCKSNSDGEYNQYSSASDTIIKGSYESPQYIINRGFFSFNTSSLGSSATITAVRFNFYCSSSNTTLHVLQSSQNSATTLANTDYDNITFTSGGSVALSGNGWKYIDLNSTGFGFINKTGNTLLSLITDKDYSNTTPVSNNEVDIRSSYNGYSPYLEITYSTSTDYPLTAEKGTFTLTGQDALLKVAYKMLASVGSFTLTGFNALFSKGYGIVAFAGSFILTGKDALFNKTLTMLASAGSFILTGKDAVFNRTVKMGASVGSFVLTFIRTKVGWPFTNVSKNSSSWTNNSKNSSTFTNNSKNSSNWTNTSK